jgi:N-acyl homoserine lactone hydrolase
VVHLEGLITGSIRLPLGWVFRSEAAGFREAMGLGAAADQRLDVPVGAFVIHHSKAGVVLVDTGFGAAAAYARMRHLGVVNGAFLRGLTMAESDAVADQLRAMSIGPGDVRTVVMTHLHADHTGGMADFPDATFVTTRAEWQAARRFAAPFNGYARRHLPDGRRMPFVDFTEGVPVEEFGQGVDLLGDGTVLLVSTPGHSAGHLSVLVQDSRGDVLLLGDAVYTLRNLDEDVLPWRTASDTLYARTLARLRAYRETCPGTLLVATHDADAWSRLRSRPRRPPV